MSFKSYFVHYKNKYGGMVHMTDSSLDVYNQEGEHCVALRKNGAGQIVDASKEFGCKESHDLAPIEKKFRAHKLFKDGSIGKDEEYLSRSEECKKAYKDHGKVYSESEWSKIKPKKAQ